MKNKILVYKTIKSSVFVCVCVSNNWFGSTEESKRIFLLGFRLKG